jgi:hypothetical protein
MAWYLISVRTGIFVLCERKLIRGGLLTLLCAFPTQRTLKTGSSFRQSTGGSIQTPYCCLEERFCVGGGLWPEPFRQLGGNHDVSHPRWARPRSGHPWPQLEEQEWVDRGSAVASLDVVVPD